MFNVVNENNEFKLGNIVKVFTIPETPKRIALFSVESYEDDGLSDLYVAYVNTGEDGYDYLEEIKENNVYKAAMESVKDIVNDIVSKKASK